MVRIKGNRPLWQGDTGRMLEVSYDVDAILFKREASEPIAIKVKKDHTVQIPNELLQEPKMITAWAVDENGNTISKAEMLVRKCDRVVASEGDPDDSYVIQLFDWDGQWIDAIISHADATDALGDNGIWYETQAADVLKSKAGYCFDTWLSVEQTVGGLATKNGAFTSNDSKLDRSNPDIANISNVSSYANGGCNVVCFQAAYVASKDTLFDFRHTLLDPVYTICGPVGLNFGDYSITVPVSRVTYDSGGNPVRVSKKLKEPGVVVIRTQTDGGQPVVDLLPLKNADTDTASFRIYLTKQTACVKYYLVDTFEVLNWKGAGARSEIQEEHASTFISNCSCGYLADQAWSIASDHQNEPNEWGNYINANLFADCFNGVSDINAQNQADYWTTEKMDAAKTAILNNTQTENHRLNSSEVLSAITGI